MSKVKIAVIGCGTIANYAHIPSYMKNDDCEIKYFCDIIPERAKEAVEKYGCGTAITDYHDILKDPEIDGISVCTPNLMHSIITIDCLKAGKNVLCEKPAAKTYKEALEMKEAQAASGGKILNIGVVNRFNMAINQIKKLIADGVCGEIYHVYVSFRHNRSIPGLGGAFTTKEIAGGGVLIDWGVHNLDIVMYCLNDPQIKTVSAEAYSKLGCDIPGYVYEDMWAGPPVLDGTYDVDDFITSLVRTEGPTISLNGAWAQNIGVNERYIDFIGDKGGIRFMYGADYTVYTTKDKKLYSYKPDCKTEDLLMFNEEINAFVNCCRTGEKIRSNIDTAVITAQMMQAMYDSSEQHKEILLNK